MYRSSARHLIITILGTFAACARADADPVAGKKLFDTQCAACHGIKATQKLTGPHMIGLIGRKAGSVEGFASSGALKKLDIKWSESLLGDYFANPAAFAPGTSKKSALTDEKQRADVIAYLKNLK